MLHRLLLGGIVPHCLSMGGIVPHRLCHLEELRPIVGVIGRNRAPSFVSLRNGLPSSGVIGRNCASSLVSVNKVVPQGLDKSKRRAAIWRPLAYRNSRYWNFQFGNTVIA